MTIEEFADKLWVTFVLPKINDFLEANQNPSNRKIKNFTKKLDQEVDIFCRVNGFKKEFTFEGKLENGVFSVTPTHLGYKNKITFLEEWV